jgi:hypothetical protein
MFHPLMFRSPLPTSAGQLKNNIESCFGDVPDIHWEGRQPRDCFVLCGPLAAGFSKAAPRRKCRAWRHEHAATPNTFWKDVHRAELFLRTFRPVGRFDPDFPPKNS